MKSVKKAKTVATIAAVGTLASLIGTGSMAVCAAETGNAYVFIRDVAEEGVRFEGIDAAVNTIKEGVETVEVGKDGSYTVTIDLSKESAFETIDEISMLKLYVCGTEKTTDVSVTVDSLKINGDEISLSGTPTVEKSGNDYYIDLCDTNGAEFFNRSDYVKTISTIDITFTISGWPVEETTTITEEATTTTSTTQAATTATTVTTAQPTTPTPTGDNGVAGIVGVMVVSALIGGAVLILKK